MEIKESVISFEVIGEGMPVVMLHGLRLDRRVMKGFMEPAFNEETSFKRIYLDLPAMGRSVASPHMKSTADMMEIIEEFVQRVLPEGDFLVAGLSYGGYLARGLAARMPSRVKGMLLVCPVIHPYDRQLEELVVCMKDDRFLEQLTAEDKEGFLSDMVVQTSAVYERYKAEITPGLQLADTEFLEGEFRTENYHLPFDPDADATAFHYPVSMITGRQDAIVGYKDAMALSMNYPHASFTVLNSAGHYVQIEQAETAKALTQAWLKQCVKCIKDV